jgi:hypothetical protein
MKLEQITVNLTAHTLNHLGSSGFIKRKEKLGKDDDEFVRGFFRYIEEYCSKNGFEVINAETAGITRNYHLVKK